MGWSTIILLIIFLALPSRFPITLADNSFVKPDDTDVTIRQIHEYLPSCSNLKPNPDDKSSFSAETAISIPGETSPSTLDTSSASVLPSLPPCLTNGEVMSQPLMSDAENQYTVRDLPQPSASTSASSSFSSSSATNSNTLQIHDHSGLTHHVIDINQPAESGQAITGTETSTQTQYPTRSFSEPSTSSLSSSPLLFTTNINSFLSQFLLRDHSLSQNSQTNLATNFELQTANTLAQLGNPRIQYPTTGHGHLPPDVINTQEVPRDQAFKLGKTFLGLTFQAVLALIVFHFQSSSPSQSPLSPLPSTSTPPIPVDIVGAAMAIGFAFTLIGSLLRNAYPNAASISEYVGIFSAAFGFFVMTEMFLPESFSWTVWPTGVILFLIFAFIIAKMR